MESLSVAGFHGEPKPGIPGFSPDPSICVVDGVFFLVTSSFHLFPGLPIYSSEDLQSWKLVCHGIHRRGQLSLRHSDTELPAPNSSTIATGGLWAPTIRHHKGVTYLICTNVIYNNGRTDSSRRNFIIHTKNLLAGEWSDPLYFDFDGIDPSLFFDDDGKTYVQICAHPRGGIWQFEIDIQTAQPLTTPKLLWVGWDRRFTEGPHMYKNDGIYYLLVAEGGTFEDHMISVARSGSIQGPFEPCPRNPLLTAAGTDNFLHHTGHGDLVQAADGSWWMAMLAVRRTGASYPLGRETFLAKVDWPKGGWPEIREPASCNIGVDRGPRSFENNSLVHLRDAELFRYRRLENYLAISASPADLSSHKDTLSFAGQRQIYLEGRSLATLRTPELLLGSLRAGSLKAGVCIYKDEHRFAAIGFDWARTQVYFEARNKANGYSAESRMAVAPGERLYLCVEYTRLRWIFQYRVREEDDWAKMAIVDTLHLSGRDFTGPIIGMFAVGDGECENQEVHFDDIRM